MCRPWCTRQRCQLLPSSSEPRFWTKAQIGAQRRSDHVHSIEMAQCFPRGCRKEDTVSSCAFQEEHPKSLVLFPMEKWLLHYHTCTLIFCITQSTNLGGKGWETLPSKIVSLLRNSQNEGVFHNPQRSRVTRKHKCIRFMSILPWSLSPQRGSWGCSSAIL